MRSIPHIRLIEFNAVLAQQGPKLVLETAGAMVFFLTVDICDEGGQLRLADGKNTVSALPGKTSELPVLLMQPPGGGGLDFLDQIALRQRARQGQSYET